MPSLYRKKRLFVPGPTPVPEEVLLRTAFPMINHREADFEQLWEKIQDRFCQLIGVRRPVYIFPAAGTGAMEAALVNLFSAGDRVLAVVIGAFGKRFADQAEAFGLDVDRLEVAWGEAVDPQEVEKALAEKRYKGVLLTYNETSTGVINPLEQIASVVGNSEALLVVDAISGWLAAPVDVEGWRVDALIGGSQKAFMVPPGLSFLYLSARAREEAEKAKLPRFYYDVRKYDEAMQKNQTPYTPAVSLLYGLDEALLRLIEEGPENTHARHLRIRDALRAGLSALRLALLARDEVASPTVTAIEEPEGVSIKELRGKLREQFGISVAGGQGMLKDKIFRVGHMGYVDELDVFTLLSAIALSLSALGVRVPHGEAVEAAAAALA